MSEATFYFWAYGRYFRKGETVNVLCSLLKEIVTLLIGLTYSHMSPRAFANRNSSRLA